MKALLRTALLVLVAAAISACYTPEQYRRNNASTAAWLDANAGDSQLNLNGTWYAEGWGHGFLRQSGNKVTGHIERFPVGGVINGTTVYLAITDEGWTSYTAVLSYAGPGLLKGGYSSDVPYNADDVTPMELRRTDR